MLDLVLYPILGTIFLIQYLDPSQDLIPGPRFGNFNQPVECYYCYCMGLTANNCFRHQNRTCPKRQPNQGKRNKFRNSR